MQFRSLLSFCFLAVVTFAQPAEKVEAIVGESAADGKQFTVAAGTRIPLSLINSVSTKSAAEGIESIWKQCFPLFLPVASSFLLGATWRAQSRRSRDPVA